MKILFLQTNYPKFLDQFYSKNKNWGNLSYKSLKSLWAKEYFGHSDFYLKNIVKYGWTGEEVILNDWNSQSVWAKESGLDVKKEELPFTDFIPNSIKNILGLRSWIKKIMFAQIDKIKPDVVYNFDLSILNAGDLKKIKSKTKLLVGQIAYPLPLIKTTLQKYDLIISSFPHYVRRFKKMGINSEYLAWCFEKSILNSVKPVKKTNDVVYIGGMSRFHSKGNKVLQEVSKDINVDVWGYIDGSVSGNSPIRNHYHGDDAWGIEMYKIFSKSKIVLNRHINISENYANNMRMFEATGMGALLITDNKKNIKDFFEPGKEIITYNNSSDLIKSIKYYLKNEKERQKIAAAGQKKTLKNHTYEIRMKELNYILMNYLGQKP